MRARYHLRHCIAKRSAVLQVNVSRSLRAAILTVNSPNLRAASMTYCRGTPSGKSSSSSCAAYLGRFSGGREIFPLAAVEEEQALEKDEFLEPLAEVEKSGDGDLERLDAHDGLGERLLIMKCTVEQRSRVCRKTRVASCFLKFVFDKAPCGGAACAFSLKLHHERHIGLKTVRVGDADLDLTFHGCGFPQKKSVSLCCNKRNGERQGRVAPKPARRFPRSVMITERRQRCLLGPNDPGRR